MARAKKTPKKKIASDVVTVPLQSLFSEADYIRGRNAVPPNAKGVSVKDAPGVISFDVLEACTYGTSGWALFSSNGQEYKLLRGEVQLVTKS